MIVSFEHNYIFIKNSKVAGTSVEMALSRHCGPRDIITPIYPRNEVWRDAEMRYPQNFSTDPLLEARYAEAAREPDLKLLWQLFRDLEPKSIFYNHMSAAEIRGHIGIDFWNGAFKFTIERNPFERIVSTAFWKFKDRDHAAKPTDDEIVEAIDVAIRDDRHGVQLYSIDGKVVVDRILRYENLRAELASIADRVGGDISARLPRAKMGARRPDQTAASLLNAEQVRRILERHAMAFDLFDYPRSP